MAERAMALADLFEEGLGPVTDDQRLPEGRGEGSRQSRPTHHEAEMAVGSLYDFR
jgi:hypothetical protein